MVIIFSIHDRILQYLSTGLLFGVVWTTVYGIDSDAASPGGVLFPFCLVYLVAFVSGEISSKILRLPKLFGMILGGFILTNFIYPSLEFDSKLSAILRNIALTTILVEGGLGLDLGVLKKTSLLILQLAFIPLIGEVIVMGLCSYFILGLPIAWSLMLGFILSCACAAIVVPQMFELRKEGLGVAKGIPSILMAACSFDDVFAIAGFSIMLGFAFNETSNIYWKVLKAPVEILVGIGAGALYGAMVGILPPVHVYSRELPSEEKKSRFALLKTSLMLFGGFGAVFISNILDFEGSGPLAALTLAVVAGIWIRRQEKVHEEIESCLETVWSLTKPFLFVLIGSEVRISQLDPEYIGWSLLCVVITAIIRLFVTYFSLSGSNFNSKEKIFASIGWLSKAAVQAAVGPIALDMARNQKGISSLVSESNINYGKIVLTTCVLAILLCTPIGALGMSLTKDKLLTPHVINNNHPDPDSTNREANGKSSQSV